MRINKLFILFSFCFLFSSGIQVFAQTDEDTSVEFDDMDDGVEADSEPQKRKKNFNMGYYTLGNGVSFLSTTDSYGINLSGYIQTSFQSQMYPEDDKMYSRFRVRRARLRLNGNALNNKIKYRLGLDMVKGSETDTEGVGAMLSDAWVSYQPWGNNKLSFAFGQRSTPTDNRELQMNSATLQFTDRSKLSSIFGTIREVGVFASGTFKIGNGSYVRPSLAITDGDGPIGLDRRYGGLKYGARLNYLPFGLFRLAGESRQSDLAYEIKPKLVIGAAYSYNDGVSDRRGGRESGAILYQNADKMTDLPDLSKLTLDFMFKWQGFSVLGEYVKTWGHVPSTIAYRVRNDGSISSDFKIDGVNHIENYIKNRMMIGSGYNLQAGYMLRQFWSFDVRYTHIMPDEYSFMTNDLYFNRSDYMDFCITKYLTKSYAAKVQANFGLAKTNGAIRNPEGESVSGWEKSFTILFQLAF
ncbi:MAG: porin [Bacteroidales bacterium]